MKHMLTVLKMEKMCICSEAIKLNKHIKASQFNQELHILWFRWKSASRKIHVHLCPPLCVWCDADRQHKLSNPVVWARAVTECWLPSARQKSLWGESPYIIMSLLKRTSAHISVFLLFQLWCFELLVWMETKKHPWPQRWRKGTFAGDIHLFTPFLCFKTTLRQTSFWGFWHFSILFFYILKFV